MGSAFLWRSNRAAASVALSVDFDFFASARLNVANRIIGFIQYSSNLLVLLFILVANVHSFAQSLFDFLVVGNPLLFFYPLWFGDNRVMGAALSDMSNGFWSLWYVSQNLWYTGEPFCGTSINAPKGGCLLPADWTGLIWMVPLSMFFDPVDAFNMTLYMQIVWTGLSMYLLYQAWFTSSKKWAGKYDAALMSAILLQMSTVIRTGLHNGSTEVLSVGWVLSDWWGGIKFLRGIVWLPMILPVIGTVVWSGGSIIIAFVQWLNQRVTLSKQSPLQVHW